MSRHYVTPACNRVDYTLYDLSSNAERPDELARPYLHEFLAAVYESYDLVIWRCGSQDWRVLESRVTW